MLLSAVHQALGVVACISNVEKTSYALSAIASFWVVFSQTPDVVALSTVWPLVDFVPLLPAAWI